MFTWSFRRTQQPTVSHSRRPRSRSHDMRAWRFLVMSVCLLDLMAGCVTEEKIKKANGHYQEGVASLESDRQQAFVSFQKAIQLNPKHKEARYYLGHLYALQGKFKLAEEQFRELLRTYPDYSEAHNYLGQVLASQDQWQDAIRSYRQALRNPLYETPDIALFHLGRALAHEGDMEAAAQAFEDALLIRPPNVPPVQVQLELGRAYYKLGFDTKAREVLLRVTSRDKGGEYAAAAHKLLERLRP